MRYLIDSDWIIDYLAGRATAATLIRQLTPTGTATSIITYMEVIEGLRGSQNPFEADQGLQGFQRLLTGVPMYGISPAIAEREADIRIALRREKRHVNHRALDILIAATAIEYGLILVTRNTRDYADILGLQLYEADP